MLAVIGFIGLHDLASSAKRRGFVIAHSFTDTMRHEPSGFVCHAEHAVQLVGAHALLGSGHEMKGANPLVQGDFASLKDRANADGELVAATTGAGFPALAT